MFKANKKLFATIISVVILGAAASVWATVNNDEFVFTDTVYTEHSLIDSPNVLDEQISLFSEDQISLFSDNSPSDRETQIYNHIAEKLEAELDSTSVQQEILIDGLEVLGVDFSFASANSQTPSEDYTAFAQYVCKTLLQNYNIMHIYAETDVNCILTSMTVEIDNTDTVEDTVNTLVAAARKRVEKGNDKLYKEYSSTFVYDYENKNNSGTSFTNKFLLDNQTRILTAQQFAAPELPFIKSAWSTGCKTAAGGLKGIGIRTVDAVPTLQVDYIDISKDEYNKFTDKLNRVYNEIVNNSMSDAQKVVAIHDWVIGQIKYGYKVDKSIIEDYMSDSDKRNIDEVVLFDITDTEEYDSQYTTIYKIAYNKIAADESIPVEERIEMLEEYIAKMNAVTEKAHTAYAPLMEGYGVCQGYTMLYSALLNKAGITNGTVSSAALGHQWSLIQLGDEWYHSDATWDDPTPALQNAEMFILSTPYGAMTVCYQGEDYLYRNNLLCSTEQFRIADNPHIVDNDTLIYIPENVECTSDDFTSTVKDTVTLKMLNGKSIDVNISKYVTGTDVSEDYEIKKSELYYNKFTNKYYYSADYIKDNTLYATKYYESSFCRVDKNGKVILPREIYSQSYDELGNELSWENFIKFIINYINNRGEEESDKETELPTVQIPDVPVVNNAVTVTAEFVSEDADSEELTLENIGTTEITLTPIEDAEIPVEEVDAYLVYYGENNVMLKTTLETVKISADGADISFEESAPEGAVSAKIIILNGGADLQPITKAINVSSEIIE